MGWMNRINELDRAAWGRVIVVVGIVTINLLLTTAFYLMIAPYSPHDDAEVYHDGAVIIGDDISVLLRPEQIPDVVYARGIYPVFVGLVYAILGEANYAAIGLIHVFMLSITVMLTYFTGRAAFNHRTGVVAALFYAVYLPVIWYSNLLMAETYLAFLVTFLLWMLALLIKTQRPLLGLIVGLTLGIVALSHAAWQLLAWVMIPLLVIQYGRNKVLRSAWPSLALVVLGLSAIFVPWHITRVVYDLPNMGQIGVAGQRGAWNFYIGSRMETWGRIAPGDRKIAQTSSSGTRLQTLYEQTQAGEILIEPIMLGIIEQRLASSDDPADWFLTDGDYYRAGIANWLDNPLDIPYLLAHKTLYYLLGQVGIVPALYDFNALYTPWLIRLSKGASAPLLIFGLLGLGVVIKQHRTYLLLFVPLIFQTGVIVLTHSEGRYKFPNMAPTFLLATLGIFAFCAYLWPRLRTFRIGATGQDLE